MFWMLRFFCPGKNFSEGAEEKKLCPTGYRFEYRFAGYLADSRSIENVP
jgi:hypothetical protein